MAIHWIDAGVLIQAERGPYPQTMVPQFWQFIHEQLVAGTIKMPRRAYKEIIDGGYTDDLRHWCMVRKEMGLCENEGKDVQDHYKTVAAHAYDNYKLFQANEFLSGGDGWIIAYALATDGIVVTQESIKSTKGKIKIPVVAKVLDVVCRNTRQMMDALKADFGPKS